MSGGQAHRPKIHEGLGQRNAFLDVSDRDEDLAAAAKAPATAPAPKAWWSCSSPERSSIDGWETDMSPPLESLASYTPSPSPAFLFENQFNSPELFGDYGEGQGDPGLQHGLTSGFALATSSVQQGPSRFAQLLADATISHCDACQFPVLFGEPSDEDPTHPLGAANTPGGDNAGESLSAWPVTEGIDTSQLEKLLAPAAETAGNNDDRFSPLLDFPDCFGSEPIRVSLSQIDSMPSPSLASPDPFNDSSRTSYSGMPLGYPLDFPPGGAISKHLGAERMPMVLLPNGSLVSAGGESWLSAAPSWGVLPTFGHCFPAPCLLPPHLPGVAESWDEKGGEGEGGGPSRIKVPLSRGFQGYTVADHGSQKEQNRKPHEKKRRRGSKMAQDPERNCPMWWLPTAVLVDLGGLVKESPKKCHQMQIKNAEVFSTYGETA